MSDMTDPLRVILELRQEAPGRDLCEIRVDTVIPAGIIEACR
jgi:hypothetical protein